jgi:hypothetical protein
MSSAAGRCRLPDGRLSFPATPETRWTDRIVGSTSHVLVNRNPQQPGWSMKCSRAVVGRLVLLSVVAGLVATLETANARGADSGAPAQSRLPYLQSDSIILFVSPANDAVSAYSKHTGKWQKQAVKIGPGEKLTPVLSQDVACFQVGNRLYGFSGRYGNWAAIDLEAGSKAEIRLTADVAVGVTKTAFTPLARWQQLGASRRSNKRKDEWTKPHLAEVERPVEAVRFQRLSFF